MWLKAARAAPSSSTLSGYARKVVATSDQSMVRACTTSKVITKTKKPRITMRFAQGHQGLFVMPTSHERCEDICSVSVVRGGLGLCGGGGSAATAVMQLRPSVWHP